MVLTTSIVSVFTPGAEMVIVACSGPPLIFSNKGTPSMTGPLPSGGMIFVRFEEFDIIVNSAPMLASCLTEKL